MTVNDSYNQYLQGRVTLIVTVTAKVTGNLTVTVILLETLTEKITVTVNDNWSQLMTVTGGSYNKNFNSNIKGNIYCTSNNKSNRNLNIPANSNSYWQLTTDTTDSYF